MGRIVLHNRWQSFNKFWVISIKSFKIHSVLYTEVGTVSRSEVTNFTHDSNPFDSIQWDQKQLGWRGKVGFVVLCLNTCLVKSYSLEIDGSFQRFLSQCFSEGQKTHRQAQSSSNRMALWRRFLTDSIGLRTLPMPVETKAGKKTPWFRAWWLHVSPLMWPFDAPFIFY